MLGTALSIDVSPDGKSVVFDMLGDLDVLPVGVGEARRFSKGVYWDAFPRCTPDGRHIAFVSDRNGLDDIVAIDADWSAHG